MKYFYALLLFSLSACFINKQTITEVESVLITYSKTNCKGKCPVFSMEIFSSGKVIFNGKENVKNIGKYEQKLPKDKLNELTKQFNEADFFNLKDAYTSLITDLPTTYISFTQNGQTKKIKDYSGAPDKLKNLEKILDEIVNSEDWKKLE